MTKEGKDGSNGTKRLWPSYDCLYVAIVTPYKKGGYEVDESALGSLCSISTSPAAMPVAWSSTLKPGGFIYRGKRRKGMEIARGMQGQDACFCG